MKKLLIGAYSHDGPLQNFSKRLHPTLIWVIYHIDRSQPIVLIGVMTEKNKNANVRQFAPRRAELQKKVQGLALDSSNVLQKSYHAKERQEERGITDVMVFEVLRTGHVEGEISPGKRPGEWKFEMTKKMKGTREVGVISILMQGDCILVVTAMWKDM